MTLRTTLAGLALAGAMVSSAAAQPDRATDNITYEGAKAIVAACEAMAQQNNWSIALWVLDITGTPVYFASINNASRIGVETARLKAETALRLGMPSEDWQPSLNSPNGQVTSTIIGLFSNAGGLPIRSNGRVVGAVGAGGLAPLNGVSRDKVCAQAGIDAVFKN